MDKYKIYFRESVWKDLGKVPKKDVKKILSKIKALGSDPPPPGCEKLSGQEKYRVRWRMYRIIYSVQDYELTVWVVEVGHRRDVYRDK
jgi:mRNA interferase RelE/StbE